MKYYNIGTVTEVTANDIVKVKLWGWSPRSMEGKEEEKKLVGVAASAGVVEGPAKVINTPAEFGRVKKGDLLVCDSTNPVWVPIFSKIRGIVTNSGGALAHPAIVAREFGIPAVVGTVTATSRIREGQRIRINGDLGEVEILD